MMNIKYKEKFPEFCSDIKGHYDLVQGDDIDSVLVSNFLEMQCWDSTRYFYDFKMLYIEKDHLPTNKLVGCDIDFIDGRCWGNHVTLISNKNDIVNPNSANLNNISKINAKANYTNKYAGSTFAKVLSYHNFDVSKLSDKAKMLIMCIDSHYLGFYSNTFHNTQKKWLVDILNYPELYDIILKSKEQDFVNLARQYNIKIPRHNQKDREGKVWINEDGYLETEIDLEGISKVLEMPITLPKAQFEPYFKKSENEPYLTLKTGYANTKYINSREQIQENIFSYSQTFTNSASFTYLTKVNPSK